jgi:hypothetical protein
MEAPIGQGQPTGHFPGDVAGQLPCRLAVRQPLQGLQHHHRGHLIGRDRRPATTRTEQVGEQLVRKQLPPVVGQKAVDRTIGHQVAAQGRSVQQLNPRGVTCPLHAGSLPHHPPRRWDLPSYLLSRLLVRKQAADQGQSFGLMRELAGRDLDPPLIAQHAAHLLPGFTG